MKINMNIYEDNTSLKLQVWLRYLSSTYIFFSKNTDTYAFSMCCFFLSFQLCCHFLPSIQPIVADFVHLCLWVTFLAHSLNWQWYSVCILLQIEFVQRLFKMLHLIVWFCHNWSVSFNNVHMKDPPPPIHTHYLDPGVWDKSAKMNRGKRKPSLFFSLMFLSASSVGSSSACPAALFSDCKKCIYFKK